MHARIIGVIAGIRFVHVTDTSDPLAPLHEESLRKIAATGIVRHFPKQTVLIHEGDVGDSLFLITRGEVNINLALPHAVKATRLATFGPGMCFGEMALIEGKPRSAQARALTDAVVYSLDAVAFAKLKSDSPAIAFKLYTALARQVAARLRNTSEQLRRNN